MTKKKNSPAVTLAIKYFKVFVANLTKGQSHPKLLIGKETKAIRKAR